MMSRFESPTSALKLDALLRYGRRALLAGSLLALAAHLCLSLVAPVDSRMDAPKPLTTQFVKRQPRLTKPLELKKRPRPRRRVLRRTMVSVKARVDRQALGSSIPAGQIARSLARPAIAVARGGAASGDVNMEPSAIAHAIEGAKEHETRVDMALEMVDVGALDTGRHRAMVIQDPSDKQLMRGFLHLGVVYCETILAVHPGSAQLNIIDYIRQVVYAMNKYTDIETDVRGYYRLDSREVLRIPWVFLNTNAAGFRVTASEAANLGAYLCGGGFLFMECSNPHAWDGPYSGELYREELISGQTMLKDGLAAAGHAHGRDWTFEKLPNDHPLFRCYFDFDGPLPSFWPYRVGRGQLMRGVTISGRLLAIFETGDYERFINDADGREGTRHRQFLVNVVVYALTQEGSLTRRLMDLVSY